VPKAPSTSDDHWGEYDGYKASNPVVSPDGKTIAFQSARSKDPAGVGYGIYLLDVAALQARAVGTRYVPPLRPTWAL
jgi:Tol biopolymer transport system component